MLVFKYCVIFLVCIVPIKKHQVFAKSLQKLIDQENVRTVDNNNFLKEEKKIADRSSKFVDDAGFDSSGGYKNQNNEDIDKNVKYQNKHQTGKYKNSGDNEDSSKNHAKHYNIHHRGEKNHKAAQYGEKSGHKRGHKTKGYNNKFFRDETHREHKFYDDAHRSGHYNKKGSNHENYENKSGSSKDLSHDNSEDAKNNYGKKGHRNKGFIDDEHARYTKSKGHQHYHHNSKNHKKHNDSSGGKQYAVVEQK